MKLLAKVGSLALIAAVAGGVVAGCSSSDVAKQGTAKSGEGPTGTIGLSLQPVSGVTLNTVHYIVTQTGSTTPVLEGDLPTPGTAKTFSFGLPLPVGAGYTISLSGASVESKTTTCVGSFGPFAVTANASTALNMVLTCTDAANGSIKGGVTVTTDACPRLGVDFVVASPSSATVPGGTIAVNGSAHDLDGKAIAYSWKVSNTAVGSFVAANAASTTFNCLSASTTPVDLTITANNGECTKSLTASVSCTSLTCGNGVLDTGEACDPSIPVGQPGFGPCLSNCKLATCGNGVVETPVEQCDPVPADPANCTATCQIRAAVCGDGFLTAGEKCDGTLFPTGTAAGSTCSADCTTITSPAVCGNGIKEAGEVCDPAFTVNDCGADCKNITSAACFTCENDPSTCSDFATCDSAVGNAAAGSPAAGTPKAQLCNSVLDCVRDTGCAVGAAPLTCYCGTANSTDCQGGLGNGKCRTQIEAGLETTTPATIVQRLKNVQFGGGVALARIDCDQTFCVSQCGL